MALKRQSRVLLEIADLGSASSRKPHIVAFRAFVAKTLSKFFLPSKRECEKICLRDVSALSKIQCWCVCCSIVCCTIMRWHAVKLNKSTETNRSTSQTFLQWLTAAQTSISVQACNCMNMGVKTKRRIKTQREMKQKETWANRSFSSESQRSQTNNYVKVFFFHSLCFAYLASK